MTRCPVRAAYRQAIHLRSTHRLRVDMFPRPRLYHSPILLRKHLHLHESIGLIRWLYRIATGPHTLIHQATPALRSRL